MNKRAFNWVPNSGRIYTSHFHICHLIFESDCSIYPWSDKSGSHLLSYRKIQLPMSSFTNFQKIPVRMRTFLCKHCQLHNPTNKNAQGDPHDSSLVISAHLLSSNSLGARSRANPSLPFLWAPSTRLTLHAEGLSCSACASHLWWEQDQLRPLNLIHALCVFETPFPISYSGLPSRASAFGAGGKSWYLRGRWGATTSLAMWTRPAQEGHQKSIMRPQQEGISVGDNKGNP